MTLSVPTVDSVILISKESVGTIIEDPLLRANAAPEVEVDLPFASPEMTAFVVTRTSCRC